MAVAVTIPKLGLTMTEATLIRWLVADGAEVKKGQPIFEIETDKVASEAEATENGVLRITAEAGAVLPVMGIIGYILAPGESMPGTSGPEPEPVELPSEAVEPESTEGHSPLIEVPAERSVASPAAKRRARELDVDINQVEGSDEGGRIALADVEAFAQARAKTTASHTIEVRASPLAKRMARETGIELATVQGTGAGGRITKEDVERVISERYPFTPSAAGTPLSEGDLIRIRGARAVVAERMLSSSQGTAPVTITSTVDATELVKVRTQLNEALSDELGSRISYNDILIQIVARALIEFPYMNARQEGGAVRLLSEVHIGLAVDTEWGLMVVVVRDADQKSISDIAREAHDKAQRATAGEISPDELTGGTFTITNLGALGVEAFTPIINPPEMAVLGVGQIKEEPAAYQGEICLRQRMVLSLTFDHRLVDGAPAARFLQRVRELIEGPLPDHRGKL